MAAWVADPTQRWLGDCLSAGSTIGACDDLARALGSRVADFRAAIARAGPSQKRLATVVDGIAWAFRADDVKPPGWGSTRGDLAPSLSYEVLAKAKQLYREDYLLYERLRRMDVGAGAGIIAIAASLARRSET